MKKLAIAGLLAAVLSLTALSEQRAAAWCGSGGFNFNIGLSVSCNWGCNCGCCPTCCPPGFCWGCPPCGYPSCGAPDCGYCAAPDCGYGAAPYGVAQMAPAYPAQQAAPLAPTAPAAVQNAAYYYPTNYGYGSYQAPSYWYGR